jgi:hypothetical protein
VLYDLSTRLDTLWRDDQILAVDRNDVLSIQTKSFEVGHFYTGNIDRKPTSSGEGGSPQTSGWRSQTLIQQRFLFQIKESKK